MLDREKYAFILNVAKEYVNIDKIVNIEEIKSGHINSTFLVTMPEAQYILQRINTDVFFSPFGMMHNIKEITEYIRRKVIFEGKDPNRTVLNIVYTIYDQVLCIKNDTYWRCFKYIEKSTAYTKVTSPNMFYEIGKAIGEFQHLLEGFHTRVLDETIPHFHDTPYRYQQFLNSIKVDNAERVKEVKKEIAFIKKRSKDFDKIVNWVANKDIPRRVTHNDTKPSNVLIDDETGKSLCLIDLDTVMKGSLLYDYGDALRIGASTAEEDEKDLSKVTIDLELFEAFNRGFLENLKDYITPKEVEGLYDGFFIITCEIAMRFLKDYIDGDIYFRTEYPTHNLVRTKNQIKIVKEIEENKDKLIEIIKKILIENQYNEEYYINL